MRKQFTTFVLAAVATMQAAAPAQAMQGYSLPANRIDAALHCYQLVTATAATLPADQRTTIAADASWFLLEALEAGNDGRPMNTQMDERAANLPLPTEAMRANPWDGLAACAARWPRSVKGGIAPLPVGKFDSNVMCASVVSLNMGILQAIPEESSFAAASRRVQDRTTAYLTDAVMDANGAATEARALEMFAERLVDAHNLGNLRDLLEACDQG